jgi:hypothetical protein
MNFYKLYDLLESFDKSLPFARFESGNNYQSYKFNILEDQYTVEFVNKTGLDPEEVYELVFFDQSGDLDLTQKNQSFAIFSTILNIIKRFITDKNPKGFYFTADAQRESVYSRLSQKIKSEIGWNLSIKKEGKETEFLFTKLP